MLTDSQRKTYDFICKFVKRYGYAPKFPEIAKGIGIKSTGVVHRYIQALIDNGLIDYTPHRHRGIRLLDKIEKTIGIPFLGKIAAGKPIEAVPDQQTVDLSMMFTGRNLYALKVCGDSMIDEGILDGDTIICEHRDSANDGDIVVALIDQQEVTLKRLKQHKKENAITLIPANSALTPITYSAERVLIQGIFKGLVRIDVN